MVRMIRLEASYEDLNIRKNGEQGGTGASVLKIEKFNGDRVN